MKEKNQEVIREKEAEVEVEEKIQEGEIFQNQGDQSLEKKEEIRKRKKSMSKKQ